MIVTITGPNDIERRQVLRKLLAEFTKKYDAGLAVEQIDGEEAPAERIQEALQSMPFLSARKLVVLLQPSKQKKVADDIEALLQAVDSSLDVVIVEPTLDKRTAYYKSLKKITDFREYEELQGNQLTGWLRAYAKERGGDVSAADVAYLVERVGSNQAILKNEIDKLLLYDRRISHSTIELLTDKTPQGTIFELLDAAFAGNYQRARALYAQQRAQKTEPQQIMAMISWQLHILALVMTAGPKNAETIAQEAHLNPFVVRKTMTLSKRLGLPQLQRLVKEALTLDIRLKRENIDADEALQFFLLSLNT